MELRELAPRIGVEVFGVDLSRPVDTATAKALNAALAAHGVLCVRDQTFDEPSFLAAGRLFGEPIEQIYDQYNSPEFPEIGVLTSEDGVVAGTGERKIRGTSWHTDASYYERPPKATVLYPELLPERGGDTEFLSLAAPFEDMGEAERRDLLALKARHVFESSRSPRKLTRRSDGQVEKYGEGQAHPLIRTLPENRRRAIYLNPIRVECIEGLTPADSDALLDRLLAHVTQPQYQYRHRWRKGDLLLWDNRQVLHQANDDYEWPRQRRRMIRLMLAGELPA